MRKEFRFWDVSEKKFIHDLLVTQYGKSAHIDCFKYFYTYEQDVVKIMQWIGFKDKNDVKIFEQDIVKYQKRLWLVRYKPNVASFVLSNKTNCINFNIFDAKHIEIVGNRFENPKLYKKVYKSS